MGGGGGIRAVVGKIIACLGGGERPRKVKGGGRQGAASGVAVDRLVSGSGGSVQYTCEHAHTRLTDHTQPTTHTITCTHFTEHTPIYTRKTNT